MKRINIIKIFCLLAMIFVISGCDEQKPTRTIYKTVIGMVDVEDIVPQKYTGSPIEPKINATYKGHTLVLGKDYTVTYSDNIEVGRAQIIMEGTVSEDFKDYTKDNDYYFYGDRYIYFDIISEEETRNIEAATVTGIEATYKYTGSLITPKPTVVFSGETLVEGTDYNVSYKDNLEGPTATVTISGIGKYEGSIILNFEIIKEKKEVKEPVITCLNPTYNGNNQPIAKCDNGDIQDANQKEVGAHTVKCVSPDDSSKVVTKTCGIYFDLSNATINYTGSKSVVREKNNNSAINPNPEPTVTAAGKTLTKGTDYTMSYSGTTGTGAVIATATGVGYYKGTKTETIYYINDANCKNSSQAMTAGLSIRGKTANDQKTIVGTMSVELCEGEEVNLVVKMPPLCGPVKKDKRSSNKVGGINETYLDICEDVSGSETELADGSLEYTVRFKVKDDLSNKWRGKNSVEFSIQRYRSYDVEVDTSINRKGAKEINYSGKIKVKIIKDCSKRSTPMPTVTPKPTPKPSITSKPTSKCCCLTSTKEDCQWMYVNTCPSGRYSADASRCEKKATPSPTPTPKPTGSYLGKPQIECMGPIYNGKSQILAICSNGTITQNATAIKPGSYKVVCVGATTVEKTCQMFNGAVSATQSTPTPTPEAGIAIGTTTSGKCCCRRYTNTTVAGYYDCVWSTTQCINIDRYIVTGRTKDNC